MTNEKKAEEYAEDYKTKDGRSLDYCDIKKAYLDGLAEGRKEVREHETTCINRLHHIEKENAELKKDKEWLDNTNNEQTEVILKLNEQIEKMKCCGNCKYRIKKNLEGKIWVELCEKSYIKNKCEEWECKE